MAHRHPVAFGVALLAALALLAPAGHAQQGSSASDSTWTTPKTPWGHPDLQGVWALQTLTPLERPAEFADRATLTEEEAARIEEEAARNRWKEGTLEDHVAQREREAAGEIALKDREGFGEVSVRNLFAAIEERRDIGLDRFVYALGIRHVGQATARLLARTYLTLDGLLDGLAAAQDRD